MMHVPKLALESAEKVIPLFVAAFLADIGIEGDKLTCVPIISPSAGTLKEVMINEAVDTIMVEKEEMK